jgi:hypothetical protein
VSQRSRSITCWYLVCSNHSMRLGFCLSLSTHASSSPCFTAFFFLPLFFRGALSIQVRDEPGADLAPEGELIHCQDHGAEQWRKCSWNLKRCLTSAIHSDFVVEPMVVFHKVPVSCPQRYEIACGFSVLDFRHGYPISFQSEPPVGVGPFREVIRAPSCCPPLVDFLPHPSLG